MKLLIITHEASRTGAPLVLLHLLRWLKTNQPNVIATVVTLEGGDLESDFKAVCNSYYNYTVITKPKKQSLVQRVFKNLKLYKPVNKKRSFINTLGAACFDVVYANTIKSVPFGHDVASKNKNTKFIVHLHELNVIIKQCLPNFKDYLPHIDQFITPSKLVKENLITNWSVNDNSVEVIYECSNIDPLPNEHAKDKKEKIFTIGASGTVHWRKGHDVFVQLARYFKSHYTDLQVKFIWVGKVPLHERIILEEDLKKLGLEETVFFTGEVKNPTVYYNDFDVFVMTSREDPFPLVCIEAGMLSKPIISFDKAVGTNEILLEGGGFVVPYLDIESMVARIVDYYESPELVKAHGAINKNVFSKFTPEHICPQFFKVIETQSQREA